MRDFLIVCVAIGSYRMRRARAAWSETKSALNDAKRESRVGCCCAVVVAVVNVYEGGVPENEFPNASVE